MAGQAQGAVSGALRKRVFIAAADGRMLGGRLLKCIPRSATCSLYRNRPGCSCATTTRHVQAGEGDSIAMRRQRGARLDQMQSAVVKGPGPALAAAHVALAQQVVAPVEADCVGQEKQDQADIQKERLKQAYRQPPGSQRYQ